MKLTGLIQKHEAPGSEKTASANVTQSLGVQAALDAAVAQADRTKTASDGTGPSADLEKLAADVAVGQRDHEVGHVEKLGAAMADSFVRQLGAYEAAADRMTQEKAASMQITAEEVAMIREVRENPQAFIAKVAAMAESNPDLSEKQATDVWDNTVQETVRTIHKTAMDHYAAGYKAITEVLGG